MVSSTLDAQQNTVLVDGKLLSGDALREYAQLKGMCPICVQTVTKRRVRKKFGRLRSGLEWEPLTATDDVAGNYTVYKGYCLQPTCWTLEEVQVKLGEKSAGKQKKSRQKKSPSQRRTSRRQSTRPSVALSTGVDNISTGSTRSKLESHSFMEKKPLKLIDEGALIEETVRSLSARSADAADFSRPTRASLYVTPTKYSGGPAQERTARRRPTFVSSTSPTNSVELGLDLTECSDDCSIATAKRPPGPSLGSDFHRTGPNGNNTEHRGRNRRVSRRHTEFMKNQPVSEHQPLTLASLCAVAERADQDRRPSIVGLDRQPSVLTQEQHRRDSTASRRPSNASQSRRPSYAGHDRRGSSSSAASNYREEYSDTFSSILGEEIERSNSLTEDIFAAHQAECLRKNAIKPERLQTMNELLSLYMYDEDETAVERDSNLWNRLKIACNSQVDLNSKENNNKHFQLLLRVIKENSTDETNSKAWELLTVAIHKKRLHLDSDHQITMNFFQAISSVLDCEEGDALIKSHATRVLFSIIRLEQRSTSSIFTNMITMLERSRRLEWVATLLDRLMFSESECHDTAESLYVVWKLLQLQSMQARDTGSVSCEEEMLMMTMIVGLVDSMLSGCISEDSSPNQGDLLLKAESSLGLLGFVASHAGATALAEREQECICTICGTLMRYQSDSVTIEGCNALCTILPLFRWEDDAESGVSGYVISVAALLLETESKPGARPFTSSGKAYKAGALACQILIILLQQNRNIPNEGFKMSQKIAFSMVDILKRATNMELAERLSEAFAMLVANDASTCGHLLTYPGISFALLDCLKKYESSVLVQEKMCIILQHLAAQEISTISSNVEQAGGIGFLTKLLTAGPSHASLHEAVLQLLNCIIPALSTDFLIESGTDLVNTILSVVESNSNAEVTEAGSMALSALLTELNKTEK